ncbi:unnamed protein product [Cyprideis torosa]|uniref:Protein Wnt n=1 Tax=Cyprideis torosa TaxID=163714 RepID=A0A7R8WXT2_9CRUS|nr:unnamed protein product [Cyprideis torosa]CAG0909381.1 unnamed protein product [Cyprideis torosa]
MSAAHSLGHPGIGGRECNRTSRGADSCDTLCCGRGYDTSPVLVTTRCRCRFHWCCRVECQQCNEWREIHTCKVRPPQQKVKPPNIQGRVGCPSEASNSSTNVHEKIWQTSRQRLPPAPDEALVILAERATRAF